MATPTRARTYARTHEHADVFEYRQWCEAHHGPSADVWPVFVGDPLAGERRMVCRSCLSALVRDGRVRQTQDGMYRTTLEFPLDCRPREHASPTRPYIVEPGHSSDIQVLRLLGYVVREIGDV